MNSKHSESVVGTSRARYGNTFDHALAKFLWLVLFRIVFRVWVRGTENIPHEGPVLLVSNHPSYFEPIFTVVFALCFLPRTIAFMAWDALFRVPFVRGVCKRYGAFPVNLTNPGRRPFQILMEELGNGGMAGIYPEGRRSRGAFLNSWKRGALLAARKTNAVILPATFVGLRSAWSKGCIWPRVGRRVEVVFHPPVVVGEGGKAEEEQVEELIRGQIESVLRQDFEMHRSRIRAAFDQAGGDNHHRAFLNQTMDRLALKW